MEKHPVSFAGLVVRGMNESDFNNNALVDALFLKINLQNRSTVVVTASFSVVASILVAGSIIYDTWQSSKRTYRPKLRKRLDLFDQISPLHVLPLILATATLIQSTVFLSVQSSGLQKLFADVCNPISQVTWTAAWTFAYVLLVFSSEAVYRSLSPIRLASRRRPSLLICFGAVVLLLLLTWVPSLIRQHRRDRCLASLMLLIALWSDFAAILTSSLILLYIVNGTVLASRLLRTSKLDFQERMEMSSIVYYLFFSVMTFAFALPFWVQAAFTRPSNTTQLMGAIALNLFGLVNAFLHLLLRATGSNMMIGPGRMWISREREKIGPTEIAIAKQITKPIIAKREKFVLGKEQIPIEEKELGDIESLGETKSILPTQQTNDTDRLDVKPALAPPTTPTALSMRARERSNYSIFPTRDSYRQTRRFVLNFNDSKENLLRPPRPAFVRHQRFSSNVSAATVQIGLRLSNIGMAINNSSKTSLQPHSPNQGGAASRSVYTASTASTSTGPFPSPLSPHPMSPTNESWQVRNSDFETDILYGPTPLNSGNTAREINIFKPHSKPKIAEQWRSKVLPPPPLLVPKRDNVAPRQPSPLRVVNNTLPDAPKPKKPWPLPDETVRLPDRKYTGSNAWI